METGENEPMAICSTQDLDTSGHQPWNKGKLIGQKPPLKPKQVWAIRTHLQLKGLVRELAMFNLAIDSKLRACDLMRLRVEDLAPYGSTRSRATVRQQKTGRAVQFEMTEATRQAVDHWVRLSKKQAQDYLFSSRKNRSVPMSTRQYARLLSSWLVTICLDPSMFGTHSLRRTKASLIYRRTGNIRAVQLLLGHRKLESTVRYLGVEVDDALAIAEQVDV
jgi:integrase